MQAMHVVHEVMQDLQRLRDAVFRAIDELGTTCKLAPEKLVALQQTVDSISHRLATTDGIAQRRRQGGDFIVRYEFGVFAGPDSVEPHRAGFQTLREAEQWVNEAVEAGLSGTARAAGLGAA